MSNLPRFYVSLFYSDGEGCHQVGGNWLRLQAGWFFTSLHRYGRINMINYIIHIFIIYIK